MNFSFQLYSARNFTPWAKVYESIASLGYSQVEGFGAVYEDPKATRAALDAAGLTMPSGHFSIDALENNLDETLELASSLGITTLYCPHILAEQRPDDAEGWSQFGNRLADIGSKVSTAGLSFGWHNHDFEFISCADGSIPMRQILEAAPKIDWEIDIAWVARAGSDPSLWITEFADRITAVHVKDIAVKGENTDEDGWADIGHGTLDWKSLMTQATTETKATLYIAEHDNPNDLERFAAQSMSSLKALV